ncbi:hypothetical protein [Gemmatimonas aurantiaca]|uniref:hypothetical protein n=1 Tax=Gemmatimonas aurantiaca TaxID=173480 RepID=UPI00301DC175
MQRLTHARAMRFGGVILGLAGALALAACDSDKDDITGTPSDTQMALGFQIARGGASDTASDVTVGPNGVIITQDDDSIVVTKVQLVLRDVRLFSNASACQANDSTMVAGCATIRLRPTIVNIPVNGNDGERVTVKVPQSSYSSLRLQLHKPTAGDSADAAFLASNPAFANVSVKVEGTYNGEAFEFTSDVNETLDVALSSAVSTGSETQQITVLVDVGKWFTKADGSLLSPIEALVDEVLGTTVDANIQAGFRVIRDQNRDGVPD